MSNNNQLRRRMVMGLCAIGMMGSYAQAALTSEQQAVYDAVLAELQKTDGTMRIGNITVDKGEEKITFPKHMIDGNVNGQIIIDGKKNDIIVGAMHLDGYRGNLYLDGDFSRNEVGGQQAAGFAGKAGSNIAWGSGNMAGVAPVAIMGKVMVNGEEKDVVTGYKFDRTAPHFSTNLWNIDTSKPQEAYATAIGFVNVAYGVGSVAFGQYSIASASGAFAGGRETIAAGENSFAFGKEVKAVGQQSVALGSETKAWADYATALGNGSEASGENSIAGGYQSKATAKAAVALGFMAEATGITAVALGDHARATGNGSFAVGEQAEAKAAHSVAIGKRTTASGKRSTALGYYSYALGADSLALGGGTVKANAAEGIAMGADAVTSVAGGVSLGRGALADRDGDTYGYNPLTGAAYDAAAIGTTVSPDKAKALAGLKEAIMEKGAERAKVDAEYNKAVQDREDMLHGRGDIEFTMDNLDRLDTLIEEKKAELDDIDAVLAPLVKQKNAITGAYLSTEAAISVGNSETGMTRQIMGLAAGTQDTDAVNVAQLKALAGAPLYFYAGGKKEGNDYTVGTTQWTMSPSDFHLDFGEGLKAEQITKDGKTYTLVSVDKKGGTGDITVHAEKKTETDTNNHFTITPAKPEMTIHGDGKNITTSIEPNNNTVKVALKDDITVNSVKIGKDGKDAKTYIDKDGLNANGNKVTHVAAGEVSKTSTDAVNGSQLFATNEAVAANTKRITNLNDTVNKLGGDIADVRTESREGNAMNAALAALKPLDFDPLQRSQVMAGISTYRGKQAVALGLAHYSNEDTLVHGGISYAGHSELMANLGISWRFGDKDDRDNRKARAQRMPQYADGPISSVYVLQDEVATLRAENRDAKARIAELEAQAAAQQDANARIEALEAQVRALLAAR